MCHQGHDLGDRLSRHPQRYNAVPLVVVKVVRHWVQMNRFS